jgi:hypothetical protein
VVSWPSGARVREHLNLSPIRFHITVGFDPHDIHDRDGLTPPKDTSSLCLFRDAHNLECSLVSNETTGKQSGPVSRECPRTVAAFPMKLKTVSTLSE